MCVTGCNAQVYLREVAESMHILRYVPDGDTMCILQWCTGGFDLTKWVFGVSLMAFTEAAGEMRLSRFSAFISVFFRLSTGRQLRTVHFNPS